ncbi:MULTISPECIES: hypothetical protein [Microbacterium]|nr:hypothetical protein [Microbacterium barkeri]MDI6942916.1 hypothetical protein [Microbacterium barkeri]MDR6877761.1 hypothetical protein [Microbacterium barkeri]
MMTQDELAAMIEIAQRRMDEIAGELREVAASVEGVSLLTTWRSEAADRFRASARDLLTALHSAAFRCEAEARALPSAAATVLFPAA